jgi:hypothetical protein
MRPTTLIATLLPALLIVGVESPPRAHHATSQQATNVRNVSTTRPAPVAPPAARNHHTDVLRSAIVSQDSRAIHISDRAAVKQFNLVEPAGVIQLFRVTVPQGTRVSLTASIPHLAGIAMAAPRSSMPSQACTQRGRSDVCTQSEEACPMPAATWHMQLRKLAGPPGEIRVQLVVA